MKPTTTSARRATGREDRTSSPRPTPAPARAPARGTGEGDGDRLAQLSRLIGELLRHRDHLEGPVLVDLRVDGVRCQIVAVGPAHPEALDLLSPREQEVVRMVAEGHTNRMIATVLDISEWTVGTHLRRVFSKLDVNSRAAMVARLYAETRPVDE